MIEVVALGSIVDMVDIYTCCGIIEERLLTGRGVLAEVSPVKSKSLDISIAVCSNNLVPLSPESGNRRTSLSPFWPSSESASVRKVHAPAMASGQQQDCPLLIGSVFAKEIWLGTEMW